MAISNHERVGKALDLLKVGLRPYFEREMRATYGERWIDETAGLFRDGRLPRDAKGAVNWDSHALLSVMAGQWNSVFSRKLGKAERNLVEELRNTRNDWAHQKPFSTDDAYRALDSIHRLLTAIAAEQAAEVERSKQELLRVRFDEQARTETRKLAVAPTEGQPERGLKPWREVVTPHPDVASGRFQQAEFAADLGQVYRGEGSNEYKNPRDFFQRTFITHGLQQLLAGAIKRLAGAGGDPVVELQTNFGGGKTHSMLALYHLFSGTPVKELPGIESVLGIAGVTTLPKTRRAVLVGTELNPAAAHRKPDGTLTHTLWGELAWQLLGKEGYKLVAEADQKAVSPGAGVLRELFAKSAPCLILIDEWIAFLRQLYGVADLPAGSFDANMTFAQALTEAVKASPRTMVVASLPASDIEKGGTAGDEALARIKNTFGRLESPWTPASAEEGFEIVRRRLFEPITQKEDFAARDAVARKFSEMYRKEQREFPSGCGEGDYQRRIEKAYPIHPELFDRLFEDWSSLDKFQRTRGVLRLMAAAIHTLWKRNDANLLIMPGNMPIDEPAVQFELMRYLDDPWRPVIETDIDGPHAVPLRMDQENPALMRYSASRRVARTIFIGSAPKLEAANKGIDDSRIKLGCAQPGETIATFGDALRRLSDQTTYLYQDGRRYWYSTQPGVTRLAQDRAAQQRDDDVLEEIRRRLRLEARSRADFARVLACVPHAEIADDDNARLVILDPIATHSSRNMSSPAIEAATECLNNRGNSPRLKRNTLVFLAADRARLEDLKKAVRDYLAWQSIERDAESLDLGAFQSNQAKSKHQDAAKTVESRVAEAYFWLLVPAEKKDPNGAQPRLEWMELKASGNDPLAVRASKRLKSDGLLVTNWAGSLLRLELDRVPLWRGDHVAVKQLADDFARYLYLPRLRDSEVLAEAIADGLGLISWVQDSFAYADGWDEPNKRYRGLQVGKRIRVNIDGEGLLVKPEAAKAQLAQEQESREEPRQDDGVRDTANDGAATLPKTEEQPTERESPRQRRFHGSVVLNPLRLGRDAADIANEIIQHLMKQPGATVEVTLEIVAHIPGGAPDDLIRTVTENCRTLKFKNFDFEED
jgi:predicted AAA+ superfamily ATPase